MLQYQYDYPPATNGYIDVTIRYKAVIGHDPPWATNQPPYTLPWTYGDQFLYAESARKQLAKDIYNVFVRVTGAQNPNKPTANDPAPNSVPTLTTTSTAYLAAQWLAQLAVNIVDYVDNDDYMTPFTWDTTNNVTVFGTELPRLLVNEVLTSGGPALPTSVWAELHNPFKNTTADTYPYPLDGGTARLMVTPANPKLLPYSAYQLQIADSVNTPSGLTGAVTALSTVSTWVPPPFPPLPPPPTTIAPADGAFRDPTQSNQGFYVVGPGGPGAGVTPTFTTASMNVVPPVTSTGLIVALQRLACPALPAGGAGGVGTLNQFITVDYFTTPKYNASYGRMQPYAATSVQVQNVPGGATSTFFSHNSPLNQNFTWLTHLDRPLVNQMELLHVCGVAPYQLTQNFANAANTLQHFAPWQDPNAMIYRALELLGVPSYMNGASMGGRVPGKVNVNTFANSIANPVIPNTVSDTEVLTGLADPGSGASTFFTNDVLTALTNMLPSRTPNGAPGPNDRPFRSLASGFIANATGAPYDSQYGPTPAPPLTPNPGTTTGSGIDDTIIRTTNTTPNSQQYVAPTPYSNMVFGANRAGHPYYRMAMLQKIFNNTTTTSNTFAVWLTVGFFEVQDTDQAGNAIIPPKIGSEIGRDQGRQIRHRLFAIIDRTGMNLTPGTFTGTPILAGSSNVTVPVAVPPNTNTLPTLLNTMVGNQVDIGPDPVTGQSEVVIPTGVDLINLTFTASFTKGYTAGTPITMRGNPGPQPRRMCSLLTAPVASGTQVAMVSGTVSNVMAGALPAFITIGPDPNTGKTEQISVKSIDTTKVGSPSNPAINTLTPIVNSYTPGTPVTWTSSVLTSPPWPVLYQPRLDSGVVLHLSVIK